MTIVEYLVTEVQMSPFSDVPRGWLPRAVATTRIVSSLGGAAVRRLRGGDQGDDALGERLFAELDGMKGMAMKVGQILSTIDVGLPEATRLRLAGLQTGARPLDAPVVRTLVAQALGSPVEALFEAFDDLPVAAASVGQVHRARWEGRAVAVKVRYPGVEDSIAADFSQLSVIAGFASAATSVDGAELVHELRARMLEECDYRREAAWMDAVRPFVTAAGADVAEVIPTRSARTVLTTGWVSGHPLEAEPLPSAVAEVLLGVGWTTLFGHGFLHADPHPGNFLVRADSPRLVVLDWGCVRLAGPAEVEPLRALFRTVLQGDRARFPTAIGDAGLVGRVDRFDMDAAWAQLQWMCAPYLVDRFRFTRAWMQEVRRFQRGDTRHGRAQAIPPLWIWLLRTLVAHYSTLARQGVEVAGRGLLESALDRTLVPLADPRPSDPATPAR